MPVRVAKARYALYVAWVVAAVVVVPAPLPGSTIVRLFGATGTRQSDVLPPDETLFEVNPATGVTSRPFALASVPGREAVAFNPINGLLYHASGRAANSDNPTRPGYVDSQFLEAIDLLSQDVTSLFDATGSRAAKPGWVIPEERRVQGPDEYHELRGLSYSTEWNRFYGTDEDGLFTLEPDGLGDFQSSYLGAPTESPHAIAFFRHGQDLELLVGDAEPGRNGTLDIWRIDPASGSEKGEPIPLEFSGDAAGVLALAQHPITGELFAILQGLDDGGDFVDRQLVTVDPSTGQVNEIADLTAHLDSLAFVVSVLVDSPVGDANFDGKVDLSDFGILKSGFGGSGQADFDSNGKVDLADFGILKATFGAVSHSQPGDFNGNGKVDLTDFGILKVNFGLGTTLSQGDANRDGKVDLSDFGVLKANFGKSTTDADAVPEPSGFLLAAIALILLAFGRRRPN